MIKKIKLILVDSKKNDSNRRNYRLLLSVFTSLLAKFVGIGATLITMPLTLNYLGTEKFGVWMVVSGVLGFITFSDFGIGMGLQNALSKSIGQDETTLQKHYISNAYFFLLFLSCSLMLFIFLFFLYYNIGGIFKLNGSDFNESANSLKYSIIVFLAGMPITLIQRILHGIQKSYLASNVLMIGSVFSLLSIIASVFFDLGLILLCVLYTMSPILAQLLFSIFFFFKYPDYFPRSKNISIEHLKPIMKTGIWTLLAQIIYSTKVNGPVIIVSATLGMVAVAEFSVVQKLIALVSAVLTMGLQPLWAVYGEAYHSNDRKWIEMALKRSIKSTIVITVLAALFFVVFGPFLIREWLGNEISVSRTIIFYFSLWMIFSSINVALTMLMNGTNNFKFQAKVSFFFVSVTLSILYFLTPFYGLAFVVIIIFLFSELIITPFYIYECRRIIKS